MKRPVWLRMPGKYDMLISWCLSLIRIHGRHESTNQKCVRGEGGQYGRRKTGINGENHYG